ncbi:hypothetical protein HELRODRAFT_160380 [Helobdella robusta]|uniref:Uncharacterized protein n=1 Tax=Helobdella robusta TaxID=6412 RepID=T1EQ63_HELRO|nr:hypothetical protein HELRODRAFT_160380 [Helobdella robusta]ESO06222.1 hypothetical protein HELRODRAFT_160380 [Helobdella robusta]
MIGLSELKSAIEVIRNCWVTNRGNWWFLLGKNALLVSHGPGFGNWLLCKENWTHNGELEVNLIGVNIWNLIKRHRLGHLIPGVGELRPAGRSHILRKKIKNEITKDQKKSSAKSYNQKSLQPLMNRLKIPPHLTGQRSKDDVHIWPFKCKSKPCLNLAPSKNQSGL